MRKSKVPNFYCIGTQKAGTTTLHEILKHHPDIYLPERKEAHFFHKDHLFDKGVKWYLEEHFNSVKDEKIIGSITPDYLYFEKSAKRIFNTFGSDLKFIVILRNPADRAYSHYRMSKFRGFEPLPFKEAIIAEKERISKDPRSKGRYSYISRGYYYSQISRYLQYFPLENFLFINFEKELSNNMDQCISKICAFLDIKFLELNTSIQERKSQEAVISIVNQLLSKNNLPFQKIINGIPVEFKKSIKKFILGINKKKSLQNKLNDEIRKKLLYEYYAEDISKLEKNLRLNNHWID